MRNFYHRYEAWIIYLLIVLVTVFFIYWLRKIQ